MMLTQLPLLAAGAMLALATTVEMTLPPKTSPKLAADCVAQQWVNANLDHLPTTYEEYASYPIKYRKAIYPELSVQTRTAFWQAHLDRFVAAHDLTPAQATLIQTIRAHMSEYVQPGVRTKGDAMYMQARSVLGVQLADDALLSLVSSSPADMGEQCSCSTAHDNCDSGYGCTEDGDGCDHNSCGIFNQDTCDGECYSAQQ
ncbi:MAG TPA: bacteriocin fulvocin C-related protein [Gemmatimonadaceae bacterium]|nr:bacteriocin fulvocin C-related protein [Gemmatimonadaceae bacterium]